MLSVAGPVKILVYVTTLGLRALLFSVSSILDVASRTFFNQKSGLISNMDSGDCQNLPSVPAAEESRGGMKFEVIYSEPTSPPPNRTQPLSPKTVFSVENIDNKLKAANERRKTLEAVKLQQANEKNTRIEEVNLKKQVQDDNFKQQSKVQLETKIVSAKEAREAQITALMERLQTHDRHISEVRKQMEKETDQLRERLQKKLELAQEKRLSMLKDLQDKQKEHLLHVKEIQLSKSNQNSNENTPEGNENQISFSG